MKFIKRLKTDKGFRFKVILLFVVIVIIFGNTESDKKNATAQAVCDIANLATCTDLGGVNSNKCMQLGLFPNPSQPLIDSCIGSGCFIGVKPDAGPLTYDAFVCLSCVPTGLRSDNPSRCCSGQAISSDFKDYDYVCKSIDADDTCTTDLQKSLGSLLGKVFPDMGCKTRFYITVFGGGLLSLVLILAVL